MNFLFWTRPAREEIDCAFTLQPLTCCSSHTPPYSAVEKLGNPGWNWQRFFTAVKRAEK